MESPVSHSYWTRLSPAGREPSSPARSGTTRASRLCWWARRQAACSLRLTRRNWRSSTAASNPGPNPRPDPSPNPSPDPYPNPYLNQAFYTSLSQEGREGYDAILSTSISKVLSSVTFIAEAQLDATALRNCGELCSYLPLRPGAMVFEQVCILTIVWMYDLYRATRPTSSILTMSRATRPTPSSSCSKGRSRWSLTNSNSPAPRRRRTLRAEPRRDRGPRPRTQRAA